MCKNNNFTITVSGEADGKHKLIGVLVSYSANLAKQFLNTNGSVVFYFRYKSDARLVLRRISKILRDAKSTPDSLQYAGAQARVGKVA